MSLKVPLSSHFTICSKISLSLCLWASLYRRRVLAERLSDCLGDHVLSDGSQSVQQLSLQPGLHDQQVHVYLREQDGNKFTQGAKKRAEKSTVKVSTHPF